MRINLKLNHFIFPFVIIFLISCKKEASKLEHPGVYFYPTEFNYFKYSVSGITITNSTISFNYGKVSIKPNTHFGRITYDVKNQTVVQNEFEYADTAKVITGLISNNKDKFLGYFLNPLNYTIDSISQNRVYNMTLLLLDNQFNTLNEKRLNIGSIRHDFTGRESQDLNNNLIKPLGNGNFIVSTATANLWSQNYLMCFDENLNEKWRIKIENALKATDDYCLKDILVSENAIYLLQNKINYDGTYDYYRVKKYDYDGNLLNVTSNSTLGSVANTILPSKSGYVVIGSQFNALTDYKTFFSTFDLNNNYISTTVLGSIINPQTNLIESPVILSNVIDCNNAYYYTTSGSQLVKVNRLFEMEWVKPMVIPSYGLEGYLVNTDENIVYIENTYWIGIPGMAFIKMDFEGKEVK